MLQNEILVNDIRKGLAYFQAYIKPGPSVNLTDTNVHAEDFVANLLNALFGWNLENTNNAVANYPCIDLIDKSLGCGIQVTAEKGSKKLSETVQCLCKHESAKQIQSLKVFSLVPKQKKYTVNDCCEGIQFDWKEDVLDFTDVVKEATKISDLDRLKLVRQKVVEAFPSIFPELQARVPSLLLPATDPKISWLAFSSRATKLVGRDDEIRLLLKFLDSSRNFSWWQILGPAGSGKSRLALGLCEQVELDGWAVGFLSRTGQEFDWRKFNPVQKTLIIIDYVASRAEYVSDAILELSRIASSFSVPVRVLLLERNELTRWSQFIREESPSESAELNAKQHDAPMVLQGLDESALLNIAEEVVLARGTDWENGDKKEFLAKIKRSEFASRPLYAMILAEFPHAEDPNDLLRQVLVKESGRRKRLIEKDEERRKMENLLFLTTVLGGMVPQPDGSIFDSSDPISDSLPSIWTFNEGAYRDFAGSSQIGDSLSGLQPDLLGERFVLDSLDAEGLLGHHSRRLFHAACRIQPDDVVGFSVRTFLDFREDPKIQTLFDASSDFPELRIFRAKVLSILFAIPGAIFHDLLNKQLDALIEAAGNHPEDIELQELTALAEYNQGCSIFIIQSQLSPVLKILTEVVHDIEFKEKARSRFDAVVSRVGVKSRIGVMALLNRGILYDDDERALESWNDVIQAEAANDETRACALNNRANYLMNRQDHDGAIRDRTNVLLLKDTSADRRFVALFRRAESYVALKKFPDAVNDLTSILESNDIIDTDKLHARLQRGIYSYYNGLSSDSRDDFNVVYKMLQHESQEVSSRILPEEVRSELASLIQKALSGIDGEDSTTFERLLEQLSQLNSSKANRMRVAEGGLYTW